MGSGRKSSSADFKRYPILYSASSWASCRYLLLDERTEYFEWLCTVRSRCFGLPPGLVSLGGNSAFLSGYEAGSAVGYLCVKWVRMLVKSPQSCAFAMVPTLMVLTPLVNNDPLLVTHGIAAFHSGVKVGHCQGRFTDCNRRFRARGCVPACYKLAPRPLPGLRATPQLSSSEARVCKKGAKAVKGAAEEGAAIVPAGLWRPP